MKLDIFKSSSCDLPCWNGIIVGHTTEKELISILNNLQIVNKEFPLSPIGGNGIFEKRYSFTFGKKDNDGQFPGFSFMHIKNDIVQEIEFISGFELTVNEAIEIFDEPEYVFTTYTHSGKIYISLFFPQKGAIVSLIKKQRGADLSEADSIEVIEIISPSLYDSVVREAYTFDGHMLDFSSWEGFGNLFEKYPPQ